MKINFSYSLYKDTNNKQNHQQFNEKIFLTSVRMTERYVRMTEVILLDLPGEYLLHRKVRHPDKKLSAAPYAAQKTRDLFPRISQPL